MRARGREDMLHATSRAGREERGQARGEMDEKPECFDKLVFKSGF